MEMVEVREDALKGDIEGYENVQLAQIQGEDKRRHLPREFFERKPMVFLLKFLFATSLVVVGSTLTFFSSSYILIALGMLLNGLIFAHFIELQHECMHGHAFASPGLNRLFGTLSGIFMCSSNTHYRYDHLRHHAWLGTPKNLEHFNYKFANLHTIHGFASAFFDLSRYARVARVLLAGALGKPVPGVDKATVSRHIKQEYFFYLVLVGASIVAAIMSPTLLKLFALAWWIPALLIAEGVHFMIEMPEHFGLNTMTDPNVLSNTRSIRSSRIVHWFVNGNDMHTAHHYHQGVPMCNVRKLHALIEDKVVVHDPSYFDLYKRIITGKIKQDMSQACMVN